MTPLYSAGELSGTPPVKTMRVGGFPAQRIRNFSPNAFLISTTPNDFTFPIAIINPWEERNLLVTGESQVWYIQALSSYQLVLPVSYFQQNARVDYEGWDFAFPYSTDLSGGLKTIAGAATLDTNVTNPTGSPVYEQANTGSFDVPYITTIESPGSGTSYPLLNSSVGGYITGIHISVANQANTVTGLVYAFNTTSSANYSMTSVSSVAYTAGGPIDVRFGTGIPNQGVSVIADASSGAFSGSPSLVIVAVITVTQQNAHPIPATIQ